MLRAERKARRMALLAGKEDPDAEANARATLLRERPYKSDGPGGEAFAQRHTLVVHKRAQRLQSIANATGRALLASTHPGTRALQR